MAESPRFHVLFEVATGRRDHAGRTGRLLGAGVDRAISSRNRISSAWAALESMPTSSRKEGAVRYRVRPAFVVVGGSRGIAEGIDRLNGAPCPALYTRW